MKYTFYTEPDPKNYSSRSDYERAYEEWCEAEADAYYYAMHEDPENEIYQGYLKALEEAIS